MLSGNIDFVYTPYAHRFQPSLKCISAIESRQFHEVEWLRILDSIPQYIQETGMPHTFVLFSSIQELQAVLMVCGLLVFCAAIWRDSGVGCWWSEWIAGHFDADTEE